MNVFYVQVSVMVGVSGDLLFGDVKNQVVVVVLCVVFSVECQLLVVQGLVKNVVNFIISSMMGSVCNQFNVVWISDVVSVYWQFLVGCYLIVVGSLCDVILEDFGYFFGVGGVMDSYFCQYL